MEVLIIPAAAVSEFFHDSIKPNYFDHFYIWWKQREISLIHDNLWELNIWSQSETLVIKFIDL